MPKVVDSYTTSGTTTQSRTFTYDNRGFLLREQLPEKGAYGNGFVYYLSYDARGHATRVVDGPNDLRFRYDSAERLVEVWEPLPYSPYARTLKSFTYATTNAWNNWKNGKLEQSVAHNYFDTLNDFSVTEVFTYGGVGGRLSARTTTALPQGGTPRVFTMSLTWNDLG